MPDWELALNYDYRFGTIAFRLHKDNVDEAVFYVPLGDLLKQLDIKPHELQAVMSPQYEWTEKVGDIEPARHRMLEETDWKDKIVLDVGGYDGFAAEIAHKGGAGRAIVLDSEQYLTYGWETQRKNGVEYITGDVMDWSEPVDRVVLFNVLYHVKDMWRFLEHIRRITKDKMYLCTLFRYHAGPWVYLYDEYTCNPTDNSVFWGPSLEAIELLLKCTGWECKRYALSHDRVLYECTPTIEPQQRNSKN